MKILSITYKLNAFRETWVGTLQSLVDRGDLGTIVDGLTKISEAIGFVVNKVHLIPSLAGIFGGFLGYKNHGTSMKFLQDVKTTKIKFESKEIENKTIKLKILNYNTIILNINLCYDIIAV